MAVRYRSDFKNLNGTYFRIDIHDVDYVGSTINEFTVGSEGFVLSYDGDTDNRMQHIIPSSVEIPMLVASSAEEGLLTQLAAGREGRHLVQIQTSDDGGSSFDDYWLGVLFADQIEITDLAYPYEVQLTATDDLKALDALEYKSTPSVPYSGSQNIASHLRNCLSKLRYYDLLPAAFLTWDEWYTCNQVDTGNSMAEEVYINHWKLWSNEDGNIEYLSTYEVLEQILSLFGLRMAQQGGGFVTQSIMAAQDGPTSTDVVLITKTNVSSVIPSTRRRITEGTTIKRLNGWTKSYLNPLGKVERRYKFADLTFVGYLQFYNTLNALLTGSSTTLADYANNVFESGDQLSMSLQLRLKHTADGTLTGDARACRVLLKATVRLGQFYLNREATFSATTYDVAVSGGTAAVPAYGYSAASWSTNSANRVEFVTEPLVMNVIEDLIFEFGITSPALSSDLAPGETDLIVAFDAVQIDSTGTEVSTYDSQFQTEQVRSVRIIPAGTADIEGDTAIYSSTNSAANDAREVYELPETILGDNLGDVSGPLACDTTTGTVAVENWTGYTGETGEIHALLCTDYLAGQSDNVPIERGNLQEVIASNVDPVLLPMDLVRINSVDFALFNLTYRANAAEYEVEMFKLVRDTGDITEVTPIRDDVGGGLPFNDVISVISQEKFGSNINDIAISVPFDAVTSVNGVSPTGGAVVIDADDIEYGGGDSVKDAIGGNIADLTTLQSAVQVGATTVALGDGDNGVYVDTTAADVALQIAKTDVVVVDASSVTMKQATTVESSLSSGFFTAETGAGSQVILAKNTSTKAIIAMADSGSTDSNQVAIASEGDTLLLQAGGSTAVTIDDSQQVGIGTVTPSATLDVVGDVEVTGDVVVAGQQQISTDQYAPALTLINETNSWVTEAIDIQKRNVTGNDLSIGIIGVGRYDTGGDNDNPRSTIYLNNRQNENRGATLQDLVIFEDGDVGVGFNSAASNFDGTGIRAKFTVNSYYNDTADRKDATMHIVSFPDTLGKMALLVQSRTADNYAYQTNNPFPYSQNLFIIYDDGSQTINGDVTHTGDTTQTGDVTHTGDTTQTGDVSVTGTVTSTGVTKASGLEATSNADSLVLKSPNGTRYRVTVANDGTLSTTSL